MQHDRLSRRELIAWLAAATGAGAAGMATLANRPSTVIPAASRPMSGAPGTTAPVARPIATSAPAPMREPTGALWSDLIAAPTDQRLLVVLELPGGNDGMSMVVPHGISGYYDLRSATAIPAADVIPVDDEVGLHPNLAGMSALGFAGVDGVGSLNPNGSHFEMLARWWGGNSTVADAYTGWIGRVADVFDDGNTPTTAISIGSGAHPIVRSASAPTLSLPGLAELWAVAGADDGDEFMASFQNGLGTIAAGGDGPAGDAQQVFRRELGAIRAFGQQIGAGGDEDGLEGLGYDWELGRALHLAAAIAAADVGVRVLHVVMPGDFDTHDEHPWRHAELMASLDRNLVAFHSELSDLGVADRVAVMTVSEFGRTPRENGSQGLDHGTASSALVLGPGALGRHGEHPSLASFDENNDLITSVAFERYLGGVVEQWLGVPAAEIFPLPDDLVSPFA